jgi:phytanoyl-CoA dioxygenase PhyH
MLAPAMKNLERDGAAIVRGFLDEETRRRIVDIIEIAFTYLVSGQGDQPIRETWDNVGSIWLPSLSRCGVGAELARELSSLLEWEANKLLGPSYLAADICSIRRIHKKHVRLEWHTDYDGGGTSPYDPCYNIWLPLTAVGINQPTVEIIRGSHRRMRDLPFPSPHNGQFPDEWVARYFAPAARVAPELAPGDALVFDHWTLHRTQVLNGVALGRTSIECRVTQRDAYLAALPSG